jgi:hypothetical protein
MFNLSSNDLGPYNVTKNIYIYIEIQALKIYNLLFFFISAINILKATKTWKNDVLLLIANYAIASVIS